MHVKHDHKVEYYQNQVHAPLIYAKQSQSSLISIG
jgi:hypothetical protein